MKNKNIIKIETVAVLKCKHQDIEIHLKPSSNRGIFPLNWFQILLYKTLGFEYVCGVNYIKLMSSRLKR